MEEGLARWGELYESNNDVNFGKAIKWDEENDREDNPDFIYSDT